MRALLGARYLPFVFLYGMRMFTALGRAIAQREAREASGIAMT